MRSSTELRGDLSPVDLLFGRVFATPDGPAVLRELCPADAQRIEASVSRCRRQWSTGAAHG